MGKIELVSLELEKPQNIYLAGEKVTGTLNVTCSGTDIKVRSIHLDILGQAIVNWKELKKFNGSNTSHWKTYSSEESYINVKHKSLINDALFRFNNGMSKARGHIKLTEGAYSFPFTFVLPDNLPTTFSSYNTGSIVYTLTGTVDCPWSLDKQCCTIIKVIANYDLSRELELSRPYIVNEKVFFPTFCCSQVPVSVIFGIKKQAFASGETIDILLEVNNTSNTRLGQMSVILAEETTFKAQKNKIETYILVSKNLEPITAKDCKRYEMLKIKVPRVCTSSNGTCQIMDVKHFLEFSPTGELNVNENLIIPIKIGSKAPRVDSALNNTASIFDQINQQDQLQISDDPWI